MKRCDKCLFLTSILGLILAGKSENEDLEGSASGYVFNKFGNGPGRVVILEDEPLSHYLQARKPFPYNPSTSRSFVVSQIQNHPSSVFKYQPPDAPITYRITVPIYHDQPPPKYQKKHKNVKSHESIKKAPKFISEVEEFEHYQPNPIIHYPSPVRYSTSEHIEDHGKEHSEGHGKEHSEDHEKKEGSDYGEDEHNEKGEKASKEYETEHKFTKGKKGEHFKDDHSGHYDEEKGSKKSHYDEEDDKGEYHEAKKDSKGGKFGEKKNHKKGQKTTGYHNVFHKDEYKKDHTFYDNADHKGNFHKYGNDESHHHKKHGDHKKGGKHDSGHDEKHTSKKGHSDKGHYENEDTGYEKKQGGDSHHNDYEDYKKKGGSEAGNEFSFKKGDQ